MFVISVKEKDKAGKGVRSVCIRKGDDACRQGAQEEPHRGEGMSHAHAGGTASARAEIS